MFSEEFSIFENQGFYFNCEKAFLIFIGLQDNNKIIILKYNLNTTNLKPDIYEICTLLGGIQSESEDTLGIYMKCVWKFSVEEKDSVFFYLANYETSRMITFDCLNLKISSNVEFHNSLLFKCRNVDNSSSVKCTDIQPKSDNVHKLTSTTSDTHDDKIPKIWIKDKNTIVIRSYTNPESFVSINSKTPQKTIKNILINYKKEYDDNLVDPVLFGNNILFIGTHPINDSHVVCKQ